jgi:hypothetical protein
VYIITDVYVWVYVIKMTRISMETKHGFKSHRLFASRITTRVIVEKAAMTLQGPLCDAFIFIDVRVNVSTNVSTRISNTLICTVKIVNTVFQTLTKGTSLLLPHTSYQMKLRWRSRSSETKMKEFMMKLR